MFLIKVSVFQSADVKLCGATDLSDQVNVALEVAIVNEFDAITPAVPATILEVTA